MRSAATLAWVALLTICAGPARAGEVEDLKVGQLAPNFTLKTLNPELSGAKVFALRKLVGAEAKPKTTVVLSFGASYCAPCKAELTELKPLAARFEAAGVKLAVVVTDTEPEGIADMKAFTVDKLALSYPVLSDRFGVLARRYRADQLPKTVVIGPDGKIKWISVGFKKGALAALQAQLGMP